MSNWVSILKQEKPRFSAFFRENDITEFIKEAILKEKEDGRKYGIGPEQLEKLTEKYGISKDASSLIYQTHTNSYYPTPIVDIDSYNRVLRQRIEERQKRKLKEQNKHPPRRKGQRRR
tara:strand:- start:918 stop:1271 length:354 start_codon:yes stop_codon:yes gene_type:complete